MTVLVTTRRYAYNRKGGRQVHLAVHRSALRRRSGMIRNDAGITLHANPDDERGVLLAMTHGRLDRAAVVAWRRLARELKPDVALDVGANYGEVAFSTTYEGLRELHLVEPNPAILPWLRKTVTGVSHWPCAIHLHEGAASNKAATLSLDAPAKYSGTMRVRAGGGGGTAVRGFRLDEEIALRDGDRLLFRVDVEGFELPVLEGMAGLLKGRTFAGLCEVQLADDDLIGYLGAHFDVSVVTGEREHAVDAAGLRRWIDAARRSGWAGVQKDVIVRPATRNEGTVRSARLRPCHTLSG
jgi:FkbM family methyltransferase